MKRIVIGITVFFTTCMILTLCTAQAQENNSTLVYPGENGSLVYVPDEDGNVIPDFSYAGYMGGGVKLPELPVKMTLEPVEGDDSIQIQRAINRVSDMPPDENGFRGAILLKKGIYDLHSPLWIVTGGIVLRGEGNGPEDTVLTGYGKHGLGGFDFSEGSRLINIRGAGAADLIMDSAKKITDDYVPAGTYTLNLESTRGLKKGDTIVIRRYGNEDWVRAVGMLHSKTGEPARQAPIDCERTITAVKGKRITVDIPIVCPIDSRWGGGEVIPFTDERRICQIGIENLRGVSDFDPSKRTRTIWQTVPTQGEEYFCDEDHYWNFISIDNAKNCWVRDVHTRHFARSQVLMERGSKWITVQDCDAREHVSQRSGSRRRAFAIGGEMCLVQRCTTDDGRHDFVTNGNLCGPSVFLDCVAGTRYSSSEPHGSWGFGMLYDNVEHDLTVRHTLRTTPTWCGAFCLLWNCEGMFIVQKPPFAQNWAIGQIGEYKMIHNIPLVDLTKPRGFIESQGKHVTPRSLYLTQLEERLGKDAVANIAK
ncbi:hypothetical protein ACFL6P_06450 [Candidatus Latescibacterota bacterium]